MTFSKLLSLAILGAVLICVPAMAQRFKPSDLRGDYSFHFQGTLIQGTNALPIAAVGVLTLDGEGKVTKATRFLNVAGVVVKQSATGTYTLEPDGTGTATFLVISDEGQPPSGSVDTRGVPFHPDVVAARVGRNGCGPRRQW